MLWNFLKDYVIDHTTVFHHTTQLLHNCLMTVYKSQGNLLSSSESEHGSIDRLAIATYLTIMVSMSEYEDKEGVYESKVIRILRAFGELEQDLWSLGIIRGWIRF